MIGRFLLLCCVPTLVQAQIIISAEDGKQLKPGGPASVRTADRISLYRATGKAIRPLGTLDVPASMIGPPRSVALVPGGRMALVTAAQRLDGTTVVSGSDLSLIDLSRPDAPRLVQTIRVGAGASGVAVNRAGTLALVANAGADSVSVVGIAGKTLTLISSVALPAGSKPVAVDFSADDKAAFVVAQSIGKLVRLTVQGRDVTSSGIEIATGSGAYGLAVDRAGAFAYVTNLQGSGTGAKIGTIAVVDLRGNRLVQSIEAGNTPEHVALSPDGRYLQATLINGSNAQPSAANYRDHGELKVFSVAGGRLVPLAQAKTGRWCQGAGWTADGARILLQCAEARQIEVYRFDGKTLVRDEAATIATTSRPGAMAVAGR